MKKTASNQQPEVQAIESLLADVRGFLFDQDGALLDTFAAAQSTRAKRLGVDRARLAKTLGDDHPRVTALDAKVAKRVDFGERLKTARKDQQCVAEVGPRHWAVLGRVTDGTEQPLADLKVSLVPADGSANKVLKPMTTDKLGRFRAAHHIADLVPPGKDDGGFELVITSKAGKVLFRSPEAISPMAGSFASLEIALPKAKPADIYTRTQCQGKTAKGAQCRLQAIAGTDFCARHTTKSRVS